MKHYIRHDEQNRVIKGFSTAFEQNQEGDICVNENGGRHFEYEGEVNLKLFHDNGCPIYKGMMGLLTEADMLEWENAQPNTPLTLGEQNAIDNQSNYELLLTIGGFW